jgi:hypothetical protein
MRPMWWCVVALACRRPVDPPADDTTTTPTAETAVHTGSATSPHTGSTGHTGGATASTGHTGVPPFDCSTVSPNPISVRPVPGARGYHGLAFDLAGYLYGIDTNGNVIQADFYGNGTVFAPGVGTIQGMDTLANGEIVIASDQGAIVALDPATGGTRRIATGIYAYGVVVGPDQLVYVGDRSNTYRIDPVAETQTVYLSGNQAQSLGFSPDGTKLYFTTTFGYALWQVELDGNYDPIGDPTQLSNFGQSYRDGLAVDSCGLIYVPDYGTGKMYRIDPTTGVNTVYVNFTPFSNYGHSAVFGSGIGGWLTDAIYVPQPYNNYTVGEIVTGVPGLPFP